MRVAVILLACVTALASAQLHDDVGGGPPRNLPIPLRSARFQRLPSARPVLPTQSALANQRIRRPISFKPRGGTGPDEPHGIGPGLLKPKPGGPSGPGLSIPHQVKPVNEEPEEDDKLPSRDDRDDDRDFSQEEDVSAGDSEENVARAVANLGAVGSSGLTRISGNIGGPISSQPQPAPIQYRPFQGGPPPSGRGGAPLPQSPPPPVQYRPAPKPNKPRKQIAEETFTQQVKPAPKQIKPSQIYDSRGKKPVAQIIRRYRNDNPDGSITWGFENDDGSYKEELIGVDCITRGKYGYVDPDGLRREYSYETGIRCDEEQREEEEENGFVDYQENKLVLPDGKTIDLSNMGKKQVRRPQPAYRN